MAEATHKVRTPLFPLKHEIGIGKRRAQLYELDEDFFNEEPESELVEE